MSALIRRRVATLALAAIVSAGCAPKPQTVLVVKSVTAADNDGEAVDSQEPLTVGNRNALARFLHASGTGKGAISPRDGAWVA